MSSADASGHVSFGHSFRATEGLVQTLDEATLICINALAVYRPKVA